MEPLIFDPEEQTYRLQEAVRRHDRALLGELVSERFTLVSGRSLGRLDKAGWITAALGVGWKSFATSIIQVVELGDVVIVDHDIEQEIAVPPEWAPGAPTRSRWTTTDVWAAESGAWRLVSRHPELLA